MTSSAVTSEAQSHEGAYAAPAIEERVDLVASLGKNCSNLNQESNF